jgi:hypothetical protein
MAMGFDRKVGFACQPKDQRSHSPTSFTAAFGLVLLATPMATTHGLGSYMVIFPSLFDAYIKHQSGFHTTPSPGNLLLFSSNVLNGMLCAQTRFSLGGNGEFPVCIEFNLIIL